MQAVVPEDVSFPDLPSLAGEISIGDLPDPVQTTLEQNDISLGQLRREVRQAVTQVVSEQERKEAVDLMQSALSDALLSPGDIGADLNAALDGLVGGPEAVLSQEDRQEVLSALEQRLGIAPEEAEQVMQAVETRVEEAVGGLRQSFDRLQRQAMQAAEAAASVVSSTAWWLTFASLLALAASIGGAVAGKARRASRRPVG